MRHSLVSLALLCLATWTGAVSTTNGPVSSCCLRWSNTIVRLECIVNYTVQSRGGCPIYAIVFNTQSGKRICSDPNNNWARRAMGKVDEEKRRMVEEVEREEGEAHTRGRALRCGPKKAPKKGGRNRRVRNGRRRSGRGRKGQRKNE